MTKRRRLAATLMLTLFIAICGLAVVNVKVYGGGEGGKIDLFTNKVPFDGRGLNQRSDAFQPQERVELYARVTYNEGPIANWFVAFQVLNPLNNTVAICANTTDEDGIATFSFRVPWPSEEAEREVFGDWTVVATTSIAEKVFMDKLTFQVGWIIQVINIETLNAQLYPQISFLGGETVVLNLTIRNIALTGKSAVVMVDAFDVLGYPIIHEIYEGKPVVFQPGKSVAQVFSKIPENAAVGNVTVFAVAYTALPEWGGVPYSPPCSSRFTVLTSPRRQYYLAVKTDPPGITFIPGEKWYDEGENVTLAAPDIVQVSSGVRYRFKYWDVDGVALAGNTIALVMDRNHTATAHYTLQYFLAVVSPFGVVGGGGWYDANETAYASLNTGIVDHGNGTRRVFAFWSGDASGTSYARSDPIIMDRPKTAVANWKTQYLLTVNTNPTGLSPQPSRSPAGEAGFAGGWWYDASVNVLLSAPPIRGYDFSHWNVDGVSKPAGVYQIIVHMDGPHKATAHYSVRGIEWLYLVLLVILILLIILLLVLAYRRIKQRRKIGEEAFYRGWTAWYYGYNLRGEKRGFKQ
ncbi:MAG: hypothetical protein QXK47_04995 [Candidatus Bathyarchaeia archaeon]